MKNDTILQKLLSEIKWLEYINNQKPKDQSFHRADSLVSYPYISFNGTVPSLRKEKKPKPGLAMSSPGYVEDSKDVWWGDTERLDYRTEIRVLRGFINSPLCIRGGENICLGPPTTTTAEEPSSQSPINNEAEFN